MIPVDGRPACADLIRTVHRLATAKGIPWIAVHLEAPKRFRYSHAAEERLAEHLRLVERLGGEVVQLQPSGLRAAPDFLALAKERRVSTILLARSGRPRWLNRLMGSLLEDLVHDSRNIEIRVIPVDAEAPGTWSSGAEHPDLRRMGTAIFAVSLATIAGVLLRHFIDLPDLFVMLYMLCITAVAARYGRWAGFLASVLSVVALDFFFISPRFTMAVHDLRHVGTFTVMLGVGWVVANLAEHIRAQTRMALERERHTGVLFRLSAVLAEGGSREVIQERVETHLLGELGAPVLILLADAKGDLQARTTAAVRLNAEESAVAQWAMERGAPSGRGTQNLPGSRALFLPMQGMERPVGIFAWFGDDAGTTVDSDRRSLLVASATQVSLALERARLAEERTEARIRAEHEHLRSTLLSSVSHDLRTPLGTITGATTTLLDPGPEASPDDQRTLLTTIHQEAVRLQRLVNNLLDLTRLESGQVHVSKEWIPVEEVVGSALSRLEDQLQDRALTVQLPEAWIPLDPVLFEQVLLNLLDNALKFSAPGTPLEIRGWITDARACLIVADRGPGIPEGEEERIFDKLFRGQRTAKTPGAGLGLAICRGIIQAHGGTIRAAARPGGGTEFIIELPIEGRPPELP
jgi:two-component system, OmpR family, sensor histidine kinase KdpD